MSDQFDHSTAKIPRHLAVIMDGNGRWAKKRGMPRTLGHKKGAESVKKIVHNAAELGIQYLTLFGFSSENWSRPSDEIGDLMGLLRHYLRSQTAELHKNNARLLVIGERSAFEDDIVELIENAEKLTAQNDAITVVIALNYGGRQDIAQAALKIAEQAITEGKAPSSEDMVSQIDMMLMTADIPDPDLLIRTSGEQRISNFLLWQCAYSEMVFTPVLWPDFDKKALELALDEYASRDRRFGAIKQV